MRRICILFLCTFLWASNSVAVNYVFDEFLFSKDTWHSWKLDNPLEEFNPSDLHPKAKEAYPGYELSEFNSLDGPRPRLPPSQKATSSGGSVDVDAFDDENMVEAAAKAAHCTTCHVLVSIVWQRLTSAILSGETVRLSDVKEQLADACDKDALDAMLRKHTILKMESAGAVVGGGDQDRAGGGGAAASLLFFVVRERRDGSKGASATDAEEEAVALSCKTLVLEHGADLTSVLLTQLANFRKEALRLLIKHDRDGGNTPDEQPSAAADAADGPGSRGSSGSGTQGKLPRLGGGDAAAARDDDDEYVDPDDLDEAGNVQQQQQQQQQQPGGGAGAAKAGGTAKAAAKAASSGSTSGERAVRGLVIKVNPGEPQCADLNPQCSSWAAAGECQSNPNYMIGTDKHRGQCRKSCGVCQPDDVLSSAPALSSALDSVSSALLLAVKNLGCGAGGPCLLGVSGMALSAGPVKQGGAGQAGSGKRELPPGMKELPGGFILGKPWWSPPEVRRVPSHLRKPLPSPPADSAADAAQQPDTSSSSSSPSSSPSSPSTAPSHAEVDRLLSAALAHQLLTIPSDFFTYEYLYKNHTRHFHMDRDGDITEDWLLGRFTRESVSLLSSATGEVAGLEELDLLPGSPHEGRLRANTWPYVKQVYAGGDECVLGGGRRVVRRVEARIACSPDSGVYMLVREPDFCTYVYVLYVPQLCELDYYKPRPKAGAGGGGAGGAGGGWQGGGWGRRGGRG